MSWRKVKLGDVLEQLKISVEIENSKEYKLVTVSNTGSIRLREIVKGFEIKADKAFLAKGGKFIYSRLSIHNGAFGIIPNDLEGALVTSEMPLFDFKKNISPKFLIYSLQLPSFKFQLEQLTKGVGRTRVKEASFLDLFLDLPSLIEQEEIINRISKIENQNSEISSEFTQQQDLLKQLRQSFLREAMQGKLVKQDKKDGNATDLLKKIKEEKEKLIAEKKIRKEKELQPIKEEEIPFDIPDNWVWSRLGEACQLNPRNKANDNLDVAFIPMPMIFQKYNETPQFEIRKWNEIKSGFTHFANDDVVVAKITPCFENSKAGIMKNLPNGIGAGTTELHVIRGNKFVIPEFIYAFIKNPNFLFNGEKIMRGVAGQQRVPSEYFYETLFPLPPFAEQKRIVNKLEEVMNLCEELKTTITDNQNYTNQLLQVALKDALQM